MELAHFHNRLRTLTSIDHHELPGLSGDDWHRFRTDPFRFFIRADDATAAMIWRAIEGRQPENREPAKDQMPCG